MGYITTPSMEGYQNGTLILGIPHIHLEIMENEIETSSQGLGSIQGLCWGYVGMMEKKMETIIVE